MKRRTLVVTWKAGCLARYMSNHSLIVAQVEQRMAWVDALETQLAASRATAANLLSALVAELTAA
jgi:hypothetical protein